MSYESYMSYPSDKSYRSDSSDLSACPSSSYETEPVKGRREFFRAVSLTSYS